jgi:hypothetical protein
MVQHICKLCNYTSTHKGNYDKHFLSKKHNMNIEEQNKVNIPTIINMSNNIITKIDNLSKQNESVLKQNEELRTEIEKLKEVNNQNTNKIVKEARAIKKSILSILNANFKDTPSIAYIDENEFRLELEKEYKRTINDPSNELFKRIFTDYTNKKLIKTLCDLILKFVKKEDQKSQSVFNIDSSRGNFATKIEDLWLNDKSGLQLKKYTLDMIIKFMLNVLDVYGQRLERMIKEKNKTTARMDYIMLNQNLFLEVRSFLTNSNTHKKVIIMLCPELRLDSKMLEAITQ